MNESLQKQQRQKRQKIRRRKKPLTTGQKIKKYSIRTIAVLLETVILIVVALLGIMFVIFKGPSTTARNLFTMSVRETSAMKFLANIYLSDEEIAEIEKGTEVTYEETDTSLVDLNNEAQSGSTDAWGLTDEDGDGLILQEVKGAGYQGYMLVVLDPSRVIMGCDPDSFGSQGYSVQAMADKFGAVAGINAGGFYDPNGTGDGSIPDTLVVYKGQIYYSELGCGNGFVGFDSNYIMHTGTMTVDEIVAADIQYGVCFGPALVVNGTPVDSDALPSGVNPRTAIGQRSDGAVLMLVIDGRQASSLGAKYSDLAEIMYKYGAVTACNLDGGSSSMLYLNGKYVNNSSSVIGIRDLPTTFLVMKEGYRDE